MGRNWRITVEFASVAGVVLSAIHYGPALVSVMVKSNGWTPLLILSLCCLCVGVAFDCKDYLNRRFATTDQSLRETVAEESNALGRRMSEESDTLSRRISAETARLDSAIKREADSRVGGDQMDRDRIAQLESRVGQLENERRRAPRQQSYARPVA